MTHRRKSPQPAVKSRGAENMVPGRTFEVGKKGRRGGIHEKK